MKSKNRVGRGCGLTLLLLLLSLASTAWAYDPIAASDYAFQWYNDYNPDYEKYDIVYDEEGCSYLIAGYCCDPEKHTPSLGQTFGQPWTSDSPVHWAYWVRKAVLYGTANGFDSMQILNAVWYIVDRVGYPDDIISGIGYPEDGPIKLEMVYLPLMTRPAGISAEPTLGLEGPVVKKPTRPLKSFQELYERKRIRIR